MAPPPPHRPDPPRGRSGLLRYVAAWAAGAALAAVVAITLLGGDDPEDTVTLPPVRQIDLTAAARTAGCELVMGDRWAVIGLPVLARPQEPPARAGVFEDPPSPGQLVAALRRGVIVIQYRAGASEELVEQLQTLQEVVPSGTILTPEAVPTRYEVAVLGWRRLLGCRQFSDRAVDAIRLFQGRYIGSGPDGPG